MAFEPWQLFEDFVVPVQDHIQFAPDSQSFHAQRFFTNFNSVALLNTDNTGASVLQPGSWPNEIKGWTENERIVPFAYPPVCKQSDDPYGKALSKNEVEEQPSSPPPKASVTPTQTYKLHSSSGTSKRASPLHSKNRTKYSEMETTNIGSDTDNVVNKIAPSSAPTKIIKLKLRKAEQSNMLSRGVMSNTKAHTKQRSRLIRKKPHGMPVPKTLQEASEADQMMWKWKNTGKPWNDIRREWKRLTGILPGQSTLSVRFMKLNENFAQNGGATDYDLCRYKSEAESELMAQLWDRVAAKMIAHDPCSEYNPRDLQRRYNMIMSSDPMPKDQLGNAETKIPKAEIYEHDINSGYLHPSTVFRDLDMSQTFHHNAGLSTLPGDTETITSAFIDAQHHRTATIHPKMITNDGLFTRMLKETSPTPLLLPLVYYFSDNE